MRPRYIAARRTAGLPNRHLSQRRLRRMRRRFRAALVATMVVLPGLAFALW